MLARRSGRIAAALRDAGFEPIEVHPFATLKLLGMPWQGKRTAEGRARIFRAPRPLVPGLRHPKASEHQLDAVVCALTVRLWREGKARTVGDRDEGLMVIPSSGLDGLAARVGRPPRQMANRSPRAEAPGNHPDGKSRGSRGDLS